MNLAPFSYDFGIDLAVRVTSICKGSFVPLPCGDRNECYDQRIYVHALFLPQLFNLVLLILPWSFPKVCCFDPIHLLRIKSSTPNQQF